LIAAVHFSLVRFLLLASTIMQNGKYFVSFNDGTELNY
jgi:hypothetical protein